MLPFAPEFHFLRPQWFWALLPALLLFLALRVARLRDSGWDRAINRTLLPHLLDSMPGAGQRRVLMLVPVAWLMSVIGLAGPVWQQLPQPVKQKTDGLVLIQDLSLSFYAQDLSPNRLIRAQHKLTDILKSRREGLTGLVVYAGDAHVVSPLTDDTNTILGMVDDLDPSIMPTYGSNLAGAVKLALKLFRDTGLDRGHMLLLTDGVANGQAKKVTDLLRGHHFTLSVLGVGTGDGAPIPTDDGGFLKDKQGRIIVPRLDRGILRRLAAENGGRYSDIRIDDNDFHTLLLPAATLPQEKDYRQTKRSFDQWQDQGYWLAVLLLPLGLLAFRRGWLLMGLILTFTLLPASGSYAFSWRDLWLRPDQQAARALAANHPKEAARLFKSRPWQGAAQYRAGEYQQAADAFAKGGDANDHYNRGNALAKAGKLPEAVAAYDQALKLDQRMTDARDNRALVEKLLEEQKQMQKGQGQKGNDQQQGKNRKQGDKGQQGEEQKQESKGKGQKGGENREQSQKPKDKSQPGAQGQQGRQDKEKSGQQSDADKEQKSRDQTDQFGAPQKRQDEKNKDQVQQSRAGNKGDDKKKAVAAPADENLSSEQKQALTQWLRQIPDDPGGLLRRKFEYQYRRNRARGVEGDEQSW